MQDLLAYLDTVLRVALTRFNVTAEALSRILHVTATIFRKASSGTQGQPNTVSPAVFEVIRDGLRKEGRITPSTVASTMEVNIIPEKSTPHILFIIFTGNHGF